MNISCARKVKWLGGQRLIGGQAQGKTLLLALACFVAGIAVSALWLKHRSAEGPANAGAESAAPVVLSETTLGLLQRLNGAVDIRFYCLLDKSTVSDSVAAFANRVDQLLAAYETGANGKLKVSRINSQAYAKVNAAVADGLKEFNSDKGSPCFLGLAISSGGQKETLASLAPEWEAALEGDVTRAIARVAQAEAALQPAAPVGVGNAALEAVKLSITNLDSISLEDGARVLRDAALNEFAEATKEMDAKVKEAQQRLAGAVTNQSRAVQEAARDELQRLQVEQMKKFQEIAAKSQQQIQALQQYKNAQR